MFGQWLLRSGRLAGTRFDDLRHGYGNPESGCIKFDRQRLGLTVPSDVFVYPLISDNTSAQDLTVETVDRAASEAS